MRRVSDGYTIIEVMIFLAISAVLLTAGINLISSKQAQTDFDQKMRDTQSKIQSWINDVSTGFTGGDPSQLWCKLNGNRPVVIKPPPAKPVNYSPDCIFVGKAVQFNITPAAEDGTLYAYSIFGRRADPTTGDLPSNLDQAMPAAAVGTGGGQPAHSANLTEAFDLAPAYVKSVDSRAIDNSLSHSHLVGFISTFNTEQTTQGTGNGAQDVNAYEYNLNSNSAAGDTAGGISIVNCLELAGAPCQVADPPGNPTGLQKLTVCLTDGHRTAEIIIQAENGINPNVSINYVSC